MSRNIIFVLMYHRHKLLDRIQSTYTITEFLGIIHTPVFYLQHNVSVTESSLQKVVFQIKTGRWLCPETP
jgi:hypothetical protein